jgi:hypothetical protein
MIRYVAPVSAPLDPPIPFELQCTPMQISESLFVDEFAKFAMDYSPSSPTNNLYTGSAIDLDQKFRAYDDGRMMTFREIAISGGVSVNPGGSSTNTWNHATADNVPFGGLRLKRPNCQCTNLNKFRITDPFNCVIKMRVLGFSDGYGYESSTGAQVNSGAADAALFYGGTFPLTNYALFSGMMPIGPAVMFYTMRPNEDQTKTIVSLCRADELQLGDLVLKCSNTEPTMAKGSECLTVVATGSHNYGEDFVNRIETSFPQDDFPTSSGSATMMLENGVYIAFPTIGGSY